MQRLRNTMNGRARRWMNSTYICTLRKFLHVTLEGTSARLLWVDAGATNGEKSMKLRQKRTLMLTYFTQRPIYYIGLMLRKVNPSSTRILTGAKEKDLRLCKSSSSTYVYGFENKYPLQYELDQQNKTESRMRELWSSSLKRGEQNSLSTGSGISSAV